MHKLFAVLASFVVLAACGGGPTTPTPPPTTMPQQPQRIILRPSASIDMGVNAGSIQIAPPQFSGVLDAVINWQPIPPGAKVFVYLTRTQEDALLCFWDMECKRPDGTPAYLIKDISDEDPKTLRYQAQAGEQLWVYIRNWGPEAIQGKLEIGLTR